MPDEICKVEYYSAVIPDKTGHGACALSALRDAGVNFLGLWAYPIKGRKAQVDMIPTDAKLFKKAAKQAGLELGPKKVAFFVQGEDHPGAIAEVLTKLSEAGVNVCALQAACGGAGRFGAMVQIDEADVKKAAKTLIPKK